MPKKVISNFSRLLGVMFVVLFFQLFFVGFLTFCCFHAFIALKNAAVFFPKVFYPIFYFES